MKTLTEKYNGVLRGLLNESQFLRDARMEFPNLIHPNNDFKDASRILQSKGIISEGMSDEEYAAAKEAERLEKHPEKKKIKATQALIRKEKPVKEASQPIQLNVVFNDTEDYIRAKQWFNEESEFYPSSEHDEFQTLSFEVADQDDADATERAIDQELQGSEIQSWRFELMENVINEEVDEELLDVAQTAMRISKEEGVVQHVNELPGGRGYTISDFYDSDSTVISFENGRKLNESSEFKIEPKPEKKKIKKESLVKEEEFPTTPIEKLPFVSAGKLKKVLEVVGKIKIQVGPMSSTEVKSEADLVRVLMGELIFKQVRPGVYKLQGPNDSTVTMGKGSLDETTNPCWDGYEMVGMKMKDGKEVPNCVPINENVQVKRNDILRHEPTGLELRVSTVHKNKISGVVVKAGNLSSKLKVGDVTALRPVLIGATWKKVQDLSESTDSTVQRIPLNTLEHGIRFELDQKGLGTDCTIDQYEKAKKAAIKNLQKDLMYYRRKEGAEDMPVSNTDQMVKAKLKESVKHLIKKLLSEDKPKGFTGKTFTKNGKLK